MLNKNADPLEEAQEFAFSQASLEILLQEIADPLLHQTCIALQGRKFLRKIGK